VLRGRSFSSFLLIVLSIHTILLTAAIPVCFARPGGTDKDSTMSVNLRTGRTLLGKATYYPGSLNGHRTSSGKIFYQNGDTAASNKLEAELK
jgi:hypothetical protein